MADSVEQEREQKQNFLRDEILSGGYDAMEFKEFLDNLKEDGGSNIDIWSMYELRTAVRDFKAAMQAREQENKVGSYGDSYHGYQEPSQEYQPQSTYQPDNSQPSDQQQQQQQQYEEKKTHFEEPVSGEKITDQSKEVARPRITSKSQPGDEEIFYKEMPCKKTGKTTLSQTNDLEILVSGTEVVKGGLLSMSYIVYVITVKPLGWTVRRKFEDFEWLRNYLVKQYPYMMVPPTTTKTKLKKPSPDIIKRRMAFFEKFLTNCLAFEEIITNKYFEGFLRIETDKQWKELRKEADKIKQPHRLEDMVKADGKLKLQVNPELTDHVHKSADFFAASEPIYARMRKLAKELQVQFDQVANTVFGLGECYTNLYNQAAAFNASLPVGANPKLEDCYLTLNNLMVSWGGHLLGQMKIVQDGLENFFKYSDLEEKAYKDIIKLRNTHYTEYIKAKKALDTKKERLFSLGDPSKWELSSEAKKSIDMQEAVKNKELAFSVMLPKETRQFEEIRNEYGFYSYETFAQISHAIELKCKHYARNFIQFARTQNQSLSDVELNLLIRILTCYQIKEDCYHGSQ